MASWPGISLFAVTSMPELVVWMGATTLEPMGPRGRLKPCMAGTPAGGWKWGCCAADGTVPLQALCQPERFSQDAKNPGMTATWRYRPRFLPSECPKHETKRSNSLIDLNVSFKSCGELSDA